jgi:carbonic anhydrase
MKKLKEKSVIQRRKSSVISKKWRLPVLVLVVLGVFQIVLYACAGTAPKKTETVSAQHSSAEAKHWSYTGDTGPEYWHTLDPAYAVAKDGKFQSPIDIDTSEQTVNADIAKPVIDYHETLFEVENNGHTIELVPIAESLSIGNVATIDNDSYVLQQFHFHAPSEHTLDGEPFAMEVHLVHKNAQGNLAVIGVLIAEGAENTALQEAFAALPAEVTHEGGAKPEVEINPADLVPAEEGMYRYDGSLTTPPCSEGVKWSVSTQVIEMSSEQIDAFKALYNGNNRPIQNRYGRLVHFAE